MLTTHRTRSAARYSVVLGGEHQVNARIARIVAGYVAGMYTRKVRATHHPKINRGIVRRTAAFGHGLTVVGLRRVLRSPPCVKTSANLAVAEQSFVKAKLHQKIHCLADNWSRLDAQVLHHCHTIHLRA